MRGLVAVNWLKKRLSITHSIKKKIIFTFVLLLLFVSFTIGLSSYYIAKNELDVQGRTLLENNVNMIMMLIDAKNEEVKRGAISLEEAQEQVKTYILGKSVETGKTIEVAYNQAGDKKTIKEIKRPTNKEIFLGENGYPIVYSQDGLEVAHPNLEGTNIWDMREKGKENGIYVVREQIAQALKPGGGFAYYTWTLPNSQAIGEKITFQKVDPNWGWVVVAGTYMSDFNEGANKILYISGIAMVISLLLGIVLALVVVGRIIKPVKMMEVLAAELSSGDFRDKPRQVKTNDEIGRLADSLVDMRTSIRKLMKHVHESSKQLAASSEELTASAEQSAQAASQVAGSITEVAEGAERQLSAANDTSEVVQQMSASIQQIAANANEVAGQSTQAADKANEGNKSVDKAVSQMVHVEETVISSARVIARLGQRSKEIGQIVDTISGIAGQTNLLALNAAIEAARAGEQGRGFAVVAEEVRKLAEQSQDSSKQIADLIGEIQGDTDQAVVAMDDSTREVKMGAKVVNASGQVFQEITVLVAQVSGQMKEIASAIDQMAIGSQRIVGSVNQIDELSRKASGEAQTVSAATEEQSASMEEIASASQTLSRLTQDFQQMVSKFQI